jgi:hypothetical protein
MSWIVILACIVLAIIVLIVADNRKRHQQVFSNSCTLCNKTGKTLFIRTTYYEAVSMIELNEHTFEGELCLKCAAMLNNDTVKKTMAKGVNFLFLYVIPVSVCNYFIVKNQLARAGK